MEVIMEKPNRRRTDNDLTVRNVETDAPATPSAARTNSDVARRAYELYMVRGGDRGHNAAEDWRQAERELGGGELGRSLMCLPPKASQS
jgi:hypothetical protein